MSTAGCLNQGAGYPHLYEKTRVILLRAGCRQEKYSAFKVSSLEFGSESAVLVGAFQLEAINLFDRGVFEQEWRAVGGDAKPWTVKAPAGKAAQVGPPLKFTSVDRYPVEGRLAAEERVEVNVAGIRTPDYVIDSNIGEFRPLLGPHIVEAKYAVVLGDGGDEAAVG